MKIAIVADVHGNYPALSAVIKDAIENKVDNFIFAGDYIFDLVYPNEVTELIRSLDNTYVIKGNKENYLKTLSTEDQCNWNFEQMGAAYQTYRELKAENLSYLVNLSETCFVPLPFHGRIYVTHYLKALFEQPNKTDSDSARFKQDMDKRPFSHQQFLERMHTTLKDKNICDKISKIDASVIITAHSHLQWYGYCNGKLIMNPGSCGVPLDFNVMASYTILEDTISGLRVEEKRVPYDIEETISYCRTSKMYDKGKIWCDLVFLAMRTGADHYGEFFKLAESIAKEKNETGMFFSNETWNCAGKIFFEKIDT